MTEAIRKLNDLSDVTRAISAVSVGERELERLEEELIRLLAKQE